MEFDAILCTKCLQIRTVGLVRDVVHDDMGRLYLDMRLIDAGTLSQEAHQFQGILSAAQGNENPVTILQKVIIHASFIESL